MEELDSKEKSKNAKYMWSNLTKLRYGCIQDEIVKDDTKQDDILFASSSDPFDNEEISSCESSSYSLDNEETNLRDDKVEHHAFTFKIEEEKDEEQKKKVRLHHHP